jgi:YHS domain-containing protein
MGRILGLLFLFIMVVPLIRMVVGLLARAFTSYVGGKSASGPAGRSGPARVPAGGVLRKDPVCGTFVSESVAKTLSSGGKTVHFCSDACLKKFLEQSTRA